jgi:hypothetical protein
MTRIRIGQRKAFTRAVLFSVGILLGASSTALALNGNIYIVPCDTCSSIGSFDQAARAASSVEVSPGTYIVSSRSTDRSAYVSITGTPRYRCDTVSGDCIQWLANLGSSVINQAGAVVGSETELVATDNILFGRTRSVPPVTISPTFASSFINTVSDAEIGPGISQALLAKGINPAFLAIGTVVMVKFADGTQAQFVKTENTTNMWTWTGLAWDAQGRRIDRNGTLLTNPNTAGIGSGAGTFDTLAGQVDMRGSALQNYAIWKCTTVTSVKVDGVLASYHQSTVPC